MPKFPLEKDDLAVFTPSWVSIRMLCEHENVIKIHDFQFQKVYPELKTRIVMYDMPPYKAFCN